MSPRIVLTFMLALPLTTPAGAAQWQMDEAASQLHFVARWEGNEVPGVFHDFDTRLELDPRTPQSGRLEVRVAITSADMDSGDVNEGIAGSEWFDSSSFPEARFTSTDIRSVGSDRFEARGTLTLKGVAREIVVPFTWQSTDAGARMSGELTLQRTDFNIGIGEWSTGEIIGLEVNVRFEVAFQREG